MAKNKIQASFSVADGSGGLVPVEDERFSDGPWLVEFTVPAAEADVWMSYLMAECGSRGWSSGGMSQLGSQENSGSLTIREGKQSKLTIVWERPRNEPLRVKARSSAESDLSDNEALDFIKRVNQRFETKECQEFHQRGQLFYEGLPWRGELWLDDQLRLGPPLKHASWLLAPQIILVDEIVAAIEWPDANGRFNNKLRDLTVFLSVVLGTDIRSPPQGSAWVIEGNNECELRPLGYLEPGSIKEWPERGAAPPVLTRTVSRPDFTPPGVTLEMTEQWVPDDIVSLWQMFNALSSERKDQFVEVGRAWQLAARLFPDHRTASFAFLILTCEAMKPRFKKFDGKDACDIVEALLGSASADELRNIRIEDNQPPIGIRAQHFHRARTFGTDAIPGILSSTFVDPSFDAAHRTLWITTQAALIEWLQNDCWVKFD